MKNLAQRIWRILPGITTGIAASGSGDDAHAGAGNDLVHTFTLDVAEAFDAHGIWHSTYSLSDNLLKNLLDAHPYSTAPGQYWVHACVVIELPGQAIQLDLTRANGALSQNLVNTLQTLHLEAFGKKTDPLLRPRYVVRKNSALAKGQVRVCFGQGVYVAEEGEARLWRVEQSGNAVDWELAGEIHLMQRLAVLGGDMAVDGMASAARHPWPFGKAHSITVINDRHAPQLAFYAEPADSLRIEFDAALDCYKVSANPAWPQGKGLRVLDDDLSARLADERFFCFRATRLQPSVPVVASAPVHSAVAAPAPAAVAPVVVPPITAKSVDHPVPSASVKPLAVGKSSDDGTALPHVWRRPPAAAGGGAGVGVNMATDVLNHGGEATFIATSARLQRHKVSLVGIALQRVSLYRELDILGLQFALDKQGMVVAPGSGQARLTFAVDAKDGLSVESGAARREIALGQALPVSNVLNVRIEALPAAGNYLGWYRLPQAISEPVWQGSRFAFGRTQKALQKLRLLSGSGFLHAVQDSDGDRMGLSREHFLMEVGIDGLMLTSRVKQGRLLHLDENLDFVEDMDADCKAQWLLPGGHHLVLGHYVLRYD
jgi:hypothetical protein